MYQSFLADRNEDWLLLTLCRAFVFVIAASVYYRTRCCTLYHSIVCYQMPNTADESFLTVVAGRGRGFFLGLCAAVHEACQRSLVLVVISSIRRATSIYIIQTDDYRPVPLRHSTAEAVPLTFTTPPPSLSQVTLTTTQIRSRFILFLLS